VRKLLIGAVLACLAWTALGPAAAAPRPAQNRPEIEFFTDDWLVEQRDNNERSGISAKDIDTHQRCPVDNAIDDARCSSTAF
jgi:hypothetical protein